MKKDKYLTAPEVANQLGINLSTLYSYVSRGLIRSEPTGDRKHTRRYYAEDVQKLQERKELRQNPAKAAENALHWGAPVLESTLTLIADNKLFYRGQDALGLAESHSVEQVATLMWTGEELTDAANLFAAAPGILPRRCQAVRQHVAGLTPVESFQILLPLAAVDDLLAYDLRPAAVAQTGARILRLLAAIAADSPSAEAGIVKTLQQGWVPNDDHAAKLINTALILCADHELNVSSFTARCVASAGSTPYEVVLTGLAALQGVKHGRHTERVESFLQEIDTPAQVSSVLAGRLKRGEMFPGFGHPLYSEGDPRGRILLDLAAATHPNAPSVNLALTIAEQVFTLIGERPNLDFGLVVLAHALKLPAGGPMALFALGRTIGWVGHAIEQYKIDRIIRPRARYVGQQPKMDE